MLLSTLVAGLLDPPEKKWIYLSTNFYVEDNVSKAVSLAKTAKDMGYTGFLVSDSKFLRWDALEPRYIKNAKKFRDKVNSLDMEFVACVAPIGYSNDLLSRDPNLAEGLPVIDQPFVCQEDGSLTPIADGGVLKGGGFENGTVGWDWVDEPGKVCVVDPGEHAEGAASLKMSDIGQSGNGRANQKLAVKPFHNYHVSFSVKTRGFDTPSQTNLTILSPRGQSLQHTSLPVKSDMPWTRVDLTFNSLDNSEVLLYAGVWGGNKGEIWWDDFRVGPAGLVNLVRRSGAPFKVTSLDRKTTFREGKDFEPAKDPSLGNIAWPGDYDVWHDQPKWSRTHDSRILPGDTILVSYYHTALVYDGQVTCCLGEQKVFDIVKWQVEQVKKHLAPDGYMLSHDEIRVGGWDPACTEFARSPGEALAKNVRKCTQILKANDPGKPVYVWSDMFDPFHNAQSKGYYYLVKGEAPWTGSWKGLDRDTIVVNWNMSDNVRHKSLDFFAGRGHKQILAGFYDGGGVDMLTWIKEAKSPLGVMYTTWQGDFSALREFSKAWRP